jgi:hypothetical protein
MCLLFRFDEGQAGMPVLPLRIDSIREHNLFLELISAKLGIPKLYQAVSASTWN